jgi:hypothetical protein
VGGVLRADFLEDARAVDLDGPGADSKQLCGCLVGFASYEEVKNLTLSRRQVFKTGSGEGQPFNAQSMKSH